jgi:type II secretory pathway component PulM
MIENLSQREKGFLAGGAAALLLLIIIFGIILPYRSALDNLDDRIALKQEQFNDVRERQSEYRQLRQSLAQRERKLNRGGSSAFSAIETIAARLGLRDNLVAMRPQPTSQREGMQVETVAARLERLDLQQFTNLLRAFETSNTLLNVTSMQVRARFDDTTLIDAEVQVETLKRGS